MSSSLANFLFQNGCEDRAVIEKYLNNLLKVMSKYPEYNILLSQLIEILNKNELIE